MTRQPSSSDAFLPSGALDLGMSAFSAYPGLALGAASPLAPTIHVPAATARERLPDFTFPPAPAPPGGLSPRTTITASGGFSSAPAHLVQRLTQQNALIRDAWEAERNYLEANRRRAEEVYQEERAIMEDFREAWTAERLELLHALQLLRERILRLEGENSALKAMAAQGASHLPGVLSPLASQRGDSDAGSAGHSPSGSPVPGDAAAPPSHHHHHNHKHHHQPQKQHQQHVVSSLLPPGLDGASRRPHFASPPKLHHHQHQHQQPSPSPPLPMDPRTQPETSAMRDFLAAASPDAAEAPVAVIDVQQIDPRLEGISLRATAVQKPTFAQELPTSPRTASHEQHDTHNDDDNNDDDEYEYDEDRSDGREPGASQEPEHDSLTGRTRRALAAAASRRLTMHAGHTPIHSVSVFPTMTASTGATSIASRSGDATPTRAGAHSPAPLDPVPGDDSDPHHGDADADVVVDLKHDLDLDSRQEARLTPPTDLEAELDSELGDAPLQPDNDHPLRGPLMVKNIPAQDELFWAAVNRKLEPISQGQDALPAVMQAPVPRSGPAGWARDAARDADVDGEDDDLDEGAGSGGKSLEEIDVPLRIRTTTNFGAPFGRM